MRVAPDDEVYRVNTVWLGPTGLTFPWTARYLAYAVWLLVFLVILLFELIVQLSPGVPPTWEFAISVLFTYAVMGFVDHERPLSAVFQTFAADLAAPRAGRIRSTVTTTRKVRIVRRRAEQRRAGGRRATSSRDRQAD